MKIEMKKLAFVLPLFSILCYIVSLILFKIDINFNYQYVVLFLWFFSLCIILVPWLFSLFPYKKSFIKNVDIYGIVILLILAIVTRFIFLIDYPFVSVGDELREPGLNALKIATGEIKNFFGYGAYEGYGLIIPIITSFLYKIIGSSVLVYRVPAAIVSIIDIIFIYILLSVLTKNKIASFIGSLVLITLPLHMFYSRTELVVILSSLFSTIILLTLYVFVRRKTNFLLDYVFLGILLGFTFNLYSGIKAMG